MADSMQSNTKVDRQISDLLGALTDPIIVMPGGWGDTIPEWIKQAITLERLIENMKHLNGEEPSGTDAEAVAYLYTASLEAPMGSDWTSIYLYLSRKEMLAHSKIEGDVPPDIKVETINNDQQDELLRLKQWIYRTRVQARVDIERAGRREQKEQVKKEKEILQPSMFELK